MLDSLQPSDDLPAFSGDSDPHQREPRKPNKTRKRVAVLLTVIAVCSFITLVGNKSGIIKKFAPNVPVAEVQQMTVEPTGETSTEANDNSGEFQPSPDLEMARNELLDKSLNEVGFQVNNLSEAVAETFLLQARSAIEKQPISIELFLIKKINFLANKLDAATLAGEFNGSPKERQKAADLLFEVWGNLLALKRHWSTTAADQIQLKFTTVNVSVLASEVRQFSETAMKLRALTYEQQKRTEALQKQLELEAKQLAGKGAKDGKTK
jgi:macrodomain Ter protein organizer (MatP/YcbG family)